MAENPYYSGASKKAADALRMSARFSFFGIEFSVGCDLPAFLDQYTHTYRHLLAPSQDSSESCPEFRIVSQHGDRPTIIVDKVDSIDLPSVFTRGSNRHRFKLTPAGAGGFLFEVKDAFLGDAPVMLVAKASCVIVDVERWRAYAESVIFNTIISLVPNHFLLHAGVVSWQDRGVILCGEANRGKTTLTMSLVGKGLKFLSDEVAFIDRINGTVAPFPRALGLRENTVRMVSKSDGVPSMVPTKSLSGDDKWLVDIEEMFPGCVGKTCGVEYIIFLQGFSERTELQRMPTSDALMQCLRFAHTAEADPFKSMLEIAEVIGKAKSYSLVAGPVGQTAETVCELLAS